MPVPNFLCRLQLEAQKCFLLNHCWKCFGAVQNKAVQ